jgi:hypothetical protein
MIQPFNPSPVSLIGASLAAILIIPRLGLSADWNEEFSAGNIIFRSEFPLRDVQELLDDIADLQTEIEETLGIECADREIQIHLFRNRISYQRYLAVRVPEGTKRQAFYMPSPEAGRVYAYRHRGLETDVRHETMHALLRNALPYVPLWLDEGLAEYFEVESRLRERGGGHLGELKLAMRFPGWRPHLERLEAKPGFLELNARDYRDAWGIVHFLIHGPEDARQVFRDYIKQIESGEVPGPLSETLEKLLPDYEQQIILHLKGL